jgi:fibronectin-binding autotransporter adhesin
MSLKKSRGQSALFAAAVAAIGGFATYHDSALGATTTSSNFGTAGGSYTQNFTTLTSSAVTFTGTASGTVDLGQNTGTATSQISSSNADIDDSGTGVLNGWWYQSTKAVYNTDVSGTTDTSTGGLYHYGNGSLTALGMQTTSATAGSTIGLALLNTTGSTLSTFDLTFNAATWHYGTSAGDSKTLDFGYEVASSTSSLPTLGTGTSTASGYTPYSATNSTPSGFQSDLNSTAENTGTVSIAGGWGNGQILWLTWYINTTTAQSPGIGIDTVSFTANTGGGTPNLDWTGKDANSSADDNWTTSSSNTDWVAHGTSTPAVQYNDPDTVNFTGNGLGSVVVASGGVNPGAVTITNTSGTYTFSGGSIGGSGALTMNGSGGTAVLTNTTNTYSGGTNIEAGTLEANSDAALGTGGINLEGTGTLESTGVISSAKNITVVASTGGGTINTPTGDTITTSGTTAINDDLQKSGADTLNLNGTVTFGSGGELNINAGKVTFGQSGGTITQSNSSTYNGTLVVSGTPRLNFNGASSTYGGSGAIQITNGGTLETDPNNSADQIVDTAVAITNQSSTAGGEINVPIQLNPGGTNTRGDVTQQFYSAGTFNVAIGGTSGGDGITLGSNGVISGNADVLISNSAGTGAGGAGTFTLDSQSTYNGTTEFDNDGTTTLGVSNALPTNTDLIVDTISGSVGSHTKTPTINLNGFNQQLNSLSDAQYVVPGTTAVLTVTNTNPGTTSTLTISGSTTPYEDTAGGGSTGFQGIINDGTFTTAEGDGVLNLVKGGSSTFIVNNAEYSGTTTVTGGTLQINDPVTLDNNGSSANFIADGGSGGTSSNSNAFGGSLVRNIAAAGSYDELGSTETGDIGTTANILLGANSTGNAALVAMSWRERNKNETYPTATTPPLDPTDSNGLISDVLNLSGLASTGTGSSGQTLTNTYVLEMSFNPGSIVQAEQASAAAGFIRIDWLNPNGGGTGVAEWQNAVLGDSGTGTDTTTATKNVQESFANFSTAEGGLTDSNIGNFLGSWGVDLTNDEVWAVINHESQFAVVPEPSAALIAVGLAGMGILKRRRRRSNA